MSLIIEALKKAQQLRLKERQETPSPAYPDPGNKKSRKRPGKRWMVVGIGLASLLVFAFVCWRFLSQPSPLIPSRTAVRVEKKLPVPVPEKEPQEPPGEILSSPKDILISLKDTPSVPKDVLAMQKNVLSLESIERSKGILSPEFIEGSKDRPSSPQIEKSPPKMEPSIKEKKEAPPMKQMAMAQKAIQAIPPIKSATEKSLPPPSPTPLKEKVPSKSVEVKRDDDKEHRSASEILTHFNLGVHLHNRREFSKAIHAYQKVIQLDPTYVEAYNNLGMIYQEIGDLDKAFEAYQKSVEINPLYGKGHNNLGVLFYLRGRHEEAIESFQKALSINPNNIESHINLGVLFKKQGQLAKAIECYQKALDIDPFHRETHYNVALLYEQSENIELAIGHYQQFIRLSSPSHSDLISKVERHLDYLREIKEERKSKPR
jgi:type IV pilus biogenesis/stability protein PilW